MLWNSIGRRLGYVLVGDARPMTHPLGEQEMLMSIIDGMLEGEKKVFESILLLKFMEFVLLGRHHSLTYE
jgi:hypothetical protein